MIIAAGYVVVVVAAVLALIWTMQRRLMYFPAGGVPTPDAIGLTGVEPVAFETSDGLALRGWFFGASGPSPRVTVLVFNGNAGNRAHRAPLAAAFHQHGLQVLLVDYRGYGGNPGLRPRTGSPQTAGPLERTWPVGPTLMRHGSCTSANRSEQRWLSLSPLNTRRRRSSCDRRSHRWSTWDSITIRFCRWVFFSGTGSLRSI